MTRESRVFAVRQHPKAVQIHASEWDTAIRLARSFARAHRVDVWYVEDGANRLLEAYSQPVPRRVPE